METQRRFLPHDTKCTKFLKGHYLKNSFFFFVGCICAILAESTWLCTGIIWGVLGIRLLEIFGLALGQLWLCYFAHLVGIVANYYNIINAIIHFS